jgi:two-component system NarL family sensor kinase
MPTLSVPASTCPSLVVDPAHLTALTERVLHTMPWGVLALDRQGVLQLLNPCAARLLGRPAAQVLGQPLAQVVPSGFPAELLAALHESLSAPGPVAGEFYLPYCQQWLEMSTDPTETQVLVYWQDITRVVTKRQRYQALADNTPDALSRWDADHRLLYANPAMEAKIRQPLAAMLGKTLPELGVPPSIAGPYVAAVQRVFDTGQPQLHFNAFPGSQDEQYYQMRLVPELHDGQVHTVLSIAHNVTELKQAELAAAAQAHFNAQLALASPDRIQVRELATDQVQYVNRARLPELGYDPDQVLATHRRGEGPFPGWPSDEATLEKYWAAFATATDEQVPVLEHRLRALDGTWHWYRMRGKVFARDAAGRPTQALSVAAHITAEKQAQAELHQAHDLLAAVFNATLDSLEVLRSVRNAAGELVDLEWVLTNAAAHRLTERTDLVGRRLLVEEPDLGSSGVFARLRQVADQQKSTQFEQYYPQDGTDAWFQVVAVPLGDGLVVTWQDITASRQATAELLLLQLSQQQQLANAVLMAQEVERRRIAENLHNGLGQLLYATKLHLDALVVDAAPLAFAAGKHHTAELLGTAIGQVRTLSQQLIPTVLEDFGLAAAVRDFCQTSDTPQFRLHCTVADLPLLPLPLALAIYRIAQEAVLNIVQHAQASEAYLSLTVLPGWLELRVDDNGRGFDTNQARPPGLGLNALRDRVKLLNGGLELVSSPTSGTHLHVRVPLVGLPTPTAS